MQTKVKGHRRPKRGKEQRQRIRLLTLFLANIYDTAMALDEAHVIAGKPAPLEKRYDFIIELLYEQVAEASRITCPDGDPVVFCTPPGSGEVQMCQSVCDSLIGGCDNIHGPVGVDGASDSNRQVRPDKPHPKQIGTRRAGLTKAGVGQNK